MIKKAKVFYGEHLAGLLEKTDRGYQFAYDKSYIDGPYARPISLTLPLSPYAYQSNILFPFFDGLIPEGWLLDIARAHWNMTKADRFQLLTTLCRDTIGAVTVIGEEEENA